MNIRDMQQLYDYNYWANRRILAAAEGVSLEHFLAPTGHSFGSLRGTLVHLLDSECGWRMLCQHNSLAAFNALKDDSFPTLESVKLRWNEEERAMRDYLARLTDADLASHVRYTTPEGVKRERVLWHCLFQVVNHATHHRSQAAAILNGHGYPPVVLDFTAFLNDQRA